jgi:hypothetical protein
LSGTVRISRHRVHGPSLQRQQPGIAAVDPRDGLAFAVLINPHSSTRRSCPRHARWYAA